MRVTRIDNPPVVLNMARVNLLFMPYFKGSESVNAELLVYEKKSIEQFHFFHTIHLMKLFRFRQTVCQVTSDTDYRDLIYAVNIQGDSIRLLNTQGSQSSIFASHLITSSLVTNEGLPTHYNIRLLRFYVGCQAVFPL